MKKLNKLYLLILIITLSGFTDQRKELRITYLANCGFLYEEGKSKILIDPFGTKFEKMFYLPSSETKTNIIKGNVPFDDVDLLLITQLSVGCLGLFGIASRYVAAKSKALALHIKNRIWKAGAFLIALT